MPIGDHELTGQIGGRTSQYISIFKVVNVSVVAIVSNSGICSTGRLEDDSVGEGLKGRRSRRLSKELSHGASLIAHHNVKAVVDGGVSDPTVDRGKGRQQQHERFIQIQ